MPIRVTFLGPKRPDSTTDSLMGTFAAVALATDRVRALWCAYALVRLASGGS